MRPNPDEAFRAMVVLTSATQFYAGAMVLIYGTIEVATLFTTNDILHPWLHGTLYILCAFGSMWAVFRPCPGWLCWSALWSQAIFVLVATADAVACALRQAYADDVPRPWQFISVDQRWVIAGALLYALTVWRAYMRRARRVQ